jgi:hypothetical protein
MLRNLLELTYLQKDTYSSSSCPAGYYAKQTEDNKAMGEKNAAEAEANRCQMRLGLAHCLVNALGSENDRWAKSIEDIYL